MQRRRQCSQKVGSMNNSDHIMTEIESKESLIHLQETLRGKVEHAEAWFNFGLSMASMVGVVIIPLIPASLTFMSVASEFPHLLHIPQGMAYFVGAITAIGLEFLALLTIRTALRMLKYNQEAAAFNKLPDLRPDEHLQTAPAGQGVTASAVYTVIVLSLVVLLKIYPAAVLWALIPMSLMALVAEWAFLLSVDQSERELRRRQAEVTRGRIDEIAQLNAAIEELGQRHEIDVQAMNERLQHAKDVQEELRRQAEYANNLYAESVKAFDNERQALQSEIVKLTARIDTFKTMQPLQVAPQVVSNIPVLDANVLDSGRQAANENKRNQRQENLEKLVDLLSTITDPDAINKADIARQLGVSRQTVVSYFDALQDSGRIHINGAVKVN